MVVVPHGVTLVGSPGGILGDVSRRVPHAPPRVLFAAPLG